MKDWGENLIQRWWVDGLDKRLPVIATLVGIVLIANSFAALTWKLVPVPDSPVSSVTAANNKMKQAADFVIDSIKYCKKCIDDENVKIKDKM